MSSTWSKAGGGRPSCPRRTLDAVYGSSIYCVKTARRLVRSGRRTRGCEASASEPLVTQCGEHEPRSFLELGGADLGRRIPLLTLAPELREPRRVHRAGEALPLGRIRQRLLFEMNAHEVEDIPL